MSKIDNKKGFLSKVSDSRREFMKGLATVAAATPVVSSLFDYGCTIPRVQYVEPILIFFFILIVIFSY